MRGSSFKPSIDFSSVKTLGAVKNSRGLWRHGLEVEVRGGAVRSRVAVIRLLLRRMIGHAFKFDAGSYRITIEPIDATDTWRPTS